MALLAVAQVFADHASCTWALELLLSLLSGDCVGAASTLAGLLSWMERLRRAGSDFEQRFFDSDGCVCRSCLQRDRGSVRRASCTTITALPSPWFIDLLEASLASKEAADDRRRRFRWRDGPLLGSQPVVSAWSFGCVTGRGVGDESWSIFMYSNWVLPRLITYEQQRFAPSKEGNTHPTPDDYYIKSICPSAFRGPWPRASPRATKPGRGSKRTVNS